MGLGAGCAVVALTTLATVAKLKLKTLATRKTDAFLLILFSFYFFLNLNIWWRLNNSPFLVPPYYFNMNWLYLGF